MLCENVSYLLSSDKSVYDVISIRAIYGLIYTVRVRKTCFIVRSQNKCGLLSAPMTSSI